MEKTLIEKLQLEKNKRLKSEIVTIPYIKAVLTAVSEAQVPMVKIINIDSGNLHAKVKFLMPTNMGANP